MGREKGRQKGRARQSRPLNEILAAYLHYLATSRWLSVMELVGGQIAAVVTSCVDAPSATIR